jgi:hypothetical protein
MAKNIIKNHLLFVTFSENVIGTASFEDNDTLINNAVQLTSYNFSLLSLPEGSETGAQKDNVNKRVSPVYLFIPISSFIDVTYSTFNGLYVEKIIIYTMTNIEGKTHIVHKIEFNDTYLIGSTILEGSHLDTITQNIINIKAKRIERLTKQNDIQAIDLEWYKEEQGSQSNDGMNLLHDKRHTMLIFTYTEFKMSCSILKKNVKSGNVASVFKR